MRTEEDLRNTVLDVDLSLRFPAGSQSQVNIVYSYANESSTQPRE